MTDTTTSHTYKTAPRDIASLGTIMGVWAHPDDETFSMAGIISTALHAGQVVACVTATRGEQGIQDESRWPADRLADIRTRELEHSYEILGIRNHHWLDYPDGGCTQVDIDEAAGRIVELINRYRPDSIMTFGPDGLTGHPDHQTVSHWTDRAVELAEKQPAVYHVVECAELYENLKEADQQFNIFFNIDEPPLVAADDCDICYRADDDIFAIKLAALRAMTSQTESLLKAFGDVPAFCESIRVESFVRAAR